MTDILAKYGYAPDREAMGRQLDIIASNLDKVVSDDVLRDCFSMMDLTTLSTTDTEKSVEKLVGKVNAFKVDYPDYPLPASICVYPNFAATVKARRHFPDVHITTVAGCFPTSQSFPEVKVLEVKKAIEAGAEEIDIVLALNSFLAGEFDKAYSEIALIRKCIDETSEALGRPVILKVIIESGLLVTSEKIAAASFLAMEAGADFIKTSTGKVEVNATPSAAYVMCECIKKFYEKTGRKVGFKAAGGISSAMDAVCYYSIVSTLLGREWLGKGLFRFGVSRLANQLLSAIEKKTIVYF
ncbi:MAG: deoxyribose-phosphate aldolase [Bacteroidales bacterium]|nr:deoxyribose-phosphate aldolase [Bacteroidales bacterium]